MLRGGALLAVGGALAQTSPALAADACPNAAIRAQQALERLPECRAYEQVSPVEKGGNDIVAGVGNVSPRMQMARNGGALAFASTGAFAGSPGAPQFTYYRAERGDGPEGWTTQSMTPRMAPAPDRFQNNNSILGISADGTRAVVGTLAALTPDAVEGNGNLYLRDNRSGTYELMAGSSDPRFRSAAIAFGAIFVGGNSDFSHVVFSVCAALTPDAYDSGVGGLGRNVYEWAGHRLRLVNVPPEGGAQIQESIAGSGASDAHDPRFVSEDGSRVFIGDVFGSLAYVRENGTVTRPLAVSRRSDRPHVQEEATFAAASKDGSKVLVETKVLLTDEAGANPNSDGLYVEDLESGSLANLAAPADPAATAEVGIDSVWGTTSDLSTVYFVSEARLLPDAVLGGENLYVAHRGTLRLVAQLDAGLEGGVATAIATPAVGEHGELAFVARTSLTGYDNANARCVNGRCTQVFVYDPDADGLTCASCPEDGAPAAGEAMVGGQNAASSQIGSYGNSVLADGRVFFDTPQALVDGDTNGRYDVYQYADRGLTLISSGRGDADSFFGDATTDGRDVFFTTSQRLVAQDRDDLTDVYDARAGGGLAGQMTRAVDVPCEGDACQGPVATRAGATAPASETFAGAGDEPVARRAASARIGVRGAWSVRGVATTARVTVTGAGAIAVKGRWVRSVSRKVGRAGSYALRVVLTPAGRRALARRASVRVAARVTFKPRSGRTASRRLTVTFKRAARPARASRATVEGGRS